MSCPECGKPIESMCDECGIFFERPEFEIGDLSTYNIKHKRDYKKLDHFKEVLNQFQGKEDKVIPHEVFQTVEQNLPTMMETVSDTTGVELTRIILRKSKLSKYNENAQQIWSRISGRQPPYIKKLTEEKLIKYFRQIVSVYEPLKNQKRTSFLNYYYVLFKLLDLMKENELLPHIPLLRTKQRLREHDRVWCKVCAELDWTYRGTT